MNSLFQPLSPENKEIRLVTILPSILQSSRVRCHLQVVPLARAPPFEALSYVWGDALDTKQIYLNDSPFVVTKNLEIALVHLRKRWKSRVMWIDSLCINQDDIVEKSHQIPLMGEIYSSASSVIAWLGPLNMITRLTLSWLKTFLENEKYTFYSILWWILIRLAFSFVVCQNILEYALIYAEAGVDDLVYAPYWSRMWTLPEFYLPEKEPICMCGSFEFNWWCLFEFCGRKLSNTIGAIHQKGRDPDQAERIEDFRRDLRSALNKERTLNAGGEIWPSNPRVMRSSSEFSEMLKIASTRKCSNPLDRIYALYSMCPEIASRYPADYSKSLEKVLHETAIYVISAVIWRFNLFEDFLLRDDCTVNSLLPSWVPDFTRKRAPVGNYTNHLKIPGQCKVTMDYVTMHPRLNEDDLSKLRLWGKHAGRCRVVSRFTETEDRQMILTQILEHIETLYEISVNSADDENWSRVYDHSTLVERFLATCFDGSSPDSDERDTFQRFSSRQIIENLQHWLRLFTPDMETRRGLKEGVDHGFWPRLWEFPNKVIFILDGPEVSTFGIADKGIQDGDIVVIPAAMTRPVILREDSTTPRKHNQALYKIVGLCYIQCLAEYQSSEINPFTEGLEWCSLCPWIIT